MSQQRRTNINMMSPVHLLHRAGQCADDLFSTSLHDTHLTPRQYIVLKCAAAGDGVSQTDLVDATGIDRSTLADIVRRLVERGLLARERTRRDARMYAVRVTPAGESALLNAEPATEASETKLLDAVPEADRAAFLRALRSIIDTFGPISSARVAAKAPVAEPAQSLNGATTEQVGNNS